MDDRFQEKVVIVTGAASGIGEATARRFSAEGAKVSLVDRNKDALEKVAKSLPADRTMAHAADVSDPRAVDGMVAGVVDRFGRLDVIVNTVGVHEGGDPMAISDDKWRKVMSTDVDGVPVWTRGRIRPSLPATPSRGDRPSPRVFRRDQRWRLWALQKDQKR
jgi:meso-butanediol dehydrogenase/(S,S)-butanediol dehydrogenase/diacetyl reductase